MKKTYNPFLPLHEYIADGEPHVFGDRIYLYGSHDKEGGDQYCEVGDYVGYSAPITDLSDWRYEGVIHSIESDHPAYGTGALMTAPDVVRGNDGRYYLYYHMAGGTEEVYHPIYVAVCDEPAGKYEYYGYVRNPDGTPFKRFVLGDPALINDNGVIRFYYGSSLSSRAAEAHGHQPEQPKQEIPPEVVKESLVAAQMMLYRKSREEILSEEDGIVMGAVVATLADDMLTIASEPVRIIPGEFTAKGTSFEGHAFYEASSIRKINDLYYFIYSSQLSHELCYAVSAYPDKDFVYRGTIISIGDVGYQGRREEDRLNMTANTHGSIECINGQWYVFYHRQTHNSTYSRQACAEPITILPDGSIPQVEMTSCGLNGGPLPTEGEYSAAIACNLTNGAMPHITNRKSPFDIPFITHEGDQRYVTNVKQGTLIGFKYFTFDGPIVLKVVTRGSGRGKFSVSTGAGEAGFIRLAGSDTWGESEVVLDVRGTLPLYFTYHGEDAIEFLSFRFEAVGQFGELK
ncbi:alpha-N-arabinofuranosidase [Paenibacillus sp.]|uniref:alpha-N-arabinofuranosidase n=1 Tax=Paenibacillus sp. TaxID=58172 RepID=UPI002D30EF8D|nr:alpha-N-arabinofuranosidase [Paenibacillus sp.]HZG87980.1 alpha-N-arabinofuranosidase [Paenibacillus sp.]